MRSKLQQLLDKVNDEITKTQTIAQRSKEDANVISQGASASPSTSGDREHAQNQAGLNAANLQKLRLFKEQLEAHMHTSSHSAEPISFIEVELSDGSNDQFYLVHFPIYLDNFKFVSQKSPLGQAILAKEIGESFTYKIDDQEFSGKIVNLE